VITRVLPLPGPAMINTGPLVVSTASRCGGLSPERMLEEGITDALYISCAANLNIGENHFTIVRNIDSIFLPKNNLRGS